MWRVIPFPAWETDYRELWLEEKARQGLQLVEFHGTLVEFQRSAPRATRYRIDVVEDIGQLTRRELEYLDSCGEMGWEKVTDVGGAYYFRTDDPAAPELCTDETLLLRRWKKQNNPWLLLAGVLFLTWYYGSTLVMVLRDMDILVSMRVLGFWAFPGTLITGATCVALFAADVVRAQRFRHRMESGAALRRSAPLPRRAAWYPVLRTAALLYLVAWLSWALVFRAGI